MEAFLRSRKPIVISGNHFARIGSFGSCSMAERKPTLFTHSWSETNDKHPTEISSKAICVPPLNTDVRFSTILPFFNQDQSKAHPRKPHVHERYAENFSWNIVTDEDDETISEKKLLIHPIQNQHMCGSCWAMAMAAVISDCFVVSGLTSWMPNIAPTFIMMVVPPQDGNAQCNGANPAEVAVALEKIPVADNSCIDYSWCSNDNQLCTSSSAAAHFASSFGDKLNEKIPISSSENLGACYFPTEKFLFQIDEGSDVFFVKDGVSPELFRKVIKAHIVDFGPPLAGYAVLRNFVDGHFTDPNINQGIYFERADYSSPLPRLKFSDVSDFDVTGFHAVRVLGWGMGKNVQYDNFKIGDVPYWIAANSWGDKWGQQNGYFKIAMYPFNKLSQFDAQVFSKGSPIGGMILMRASCPPTSESLPQIQQRFLSEIKRSMDDSDYKKPESSIEIEKREKSKTIWIGLVFGIIALLCAIAIALMN